MHTESEPIGEGDWVTNLDPMLGEPHEVIGVTLEGLLVCAEMGGHVVQVSPWDVERVGPPPSAGYAASEDDDG